MLHPQFTRRTAEGMPFGIGGDHQSPAAMRRETATQIAERPDVRAVVIAGKWTAQFVPASTLNRRPPPVLDPVELARSGEEMLRARLAALSIEQLRDIVAEHGMDPGKLVIKWKSADRIIDRIVEISMARAQKGDAFRSESER